MGHHCHSSRSGWPGSFCLSQCLAGSDLLGALGAVWWHSHTHLIHDLPWDQGQVHRPAVFQIFLSALLDGQKVGWPAVVWDFPRSGTSLSSVLLGTLSCLFHLYLLNITGWVGLSATSVQYRNSVCPGSPWLTCWSFIIFWEAVNKSSELNLSRSRCYSGAGCKTEGAA